MTERIDGSKSATRRMSTSGALRVGTLRALGPRRSRRIFASSAIHKNVATPRNRSPAALGPVIARMCRSAMSRTSTKLKPRRGSAGMSPVSTRLTAWNEYDGSSPATGPMTATGLTTDIVVAPAPFFMKSHAARSAIVLDCTYGVAPG